MCPIRITLTDDHPLVLAGMKALLQDVQDIEIVGEATDGQAAHSSSGASTAGELTPRESEVLRFIAQGFSNKEIANQLSISIKTVETYKARAVEKLGLFTRADIVRYGVALGWLSHSGKSA